LKCIVVPVHDKHWAAARLADKLILLNQAYIRHAARSHNREVKHVPAYSHSNRRVGVGGAVAGVPCDTIQVEDAQPYQAIIATARDRGCDLIVMASHGCSGLSAVVLGSVTNKVLTHTKTPVLVCH
jgi:hypothetical protein